MSVVEIFALQFVLSVLVFGLVARWYVAPWLAERPVHAALGILILPHAFRHIGMTFLVPGVGVSEAMPESFATAAGYGDLTAAVLAIVTLLALRGKWAVALPLAWLFSTVGVVDLANALRQAEAIPYFLSTWYIPTFIVPVLLVTHVMVLARLIKHATARRAAVSTASPGLVRQG